MIAFLYKFDFFRTKRSQYIHGNKIVISIILNLFSKTGATEKTTPTKGTRGEKNIPERPKGKFPTIESDGEGHTEEAETGNNKVRYK